MEGLTLVHTHQIPQRVIHLFTPGPEAGWLRMFRFWKICFHLKSSLFVLTEQINQWHRLLCVFQKNLNRMHYRKYPTCFHIPVAGRVFQKKSRDIMLWFFRTLFDTWSSVLQTSCVSCILLHLQLTAWPCSAMDIEIQRQLGRSALNELIQIAIHLIFEIEYRLEIGERTEVYDSDLEECPSEDDELWESGWAVEWVPALGCYPVSCRVRWLAFQFFFS